MILRRYREKGLNRGLLYVDDFCFHVLEPLGEPSTVKGSGKPILAGKYKLQAANPRINVLDVPGRFGIQIHSGNKVQDSKGCILVGCTKTADGVGNSALAMKVLLKLVRSDNELQIV